MQMTAHAGNVIEKKHRHGLMICMPVFLLFMGFLLVLCKISVLYMCSWHTGDGTSSYEQSFKL